jgi:DNA-binding transcriptional ArsR family regulator
MTAAPMVSSDSDRLAASRLLRVLADPTRMGIVELLAEGERSVGELAEALGTPRSRLGNHLACGLHCGVWTSEKRGRNVVYALADRGVLALLDLAHEVAAPHADHLASCHRIGPDWT